ncbi:MFS transporter [Streptomyces sp. NPDC101169]|uniref:MFS transporter n=1 Tax=Streptomyces sp. NPDC101169 TaxID=3366121 RepID=UPI00380C2091
MRIFMDIEPLRHRDFRRLWLAGAITTSGAQFTAVAVPMQIYGLTGSSADVGLAGLVGFVPMVLGSLWGGAVADTADRRLVLLCTNAGIGVASLLLWFQAAAHLRSVVLLLVLVGLQQACFGANAAAGGAVVPRLVPAAVLPAANTLQSTASWSAGIAGPLLAGALLPVVGSPTLYLIDAVALTATLLAVWRLPPLLPVSSGGRGLGRNGVLAGLRLLTGDKVLVVTYAADFSALFLGLPYAVYPQLATGLRGADVVGVLYAAIPVGSVLAGLLSGTFTRKRRYGPAICGAVCCWGGAIAGFGLARSLAAASGLLVLAGAALTVLSAYRKSALQTVVTDELRGRLQGADTVIAAGGPRLAGLAHGAAASLVGPMWAVTGGGLLVVAVMLVLYTAVPDFRRFAQPGIG